ncbi:receptor-like protein EIX2 [Curcuma longa]|uniref:receptor-like protein EIX2 n=1 Tax=Curcuma longa TaxID=136217 RepID=UPI003D9E6A81
MYVIRVPESMPIFFALFFLLFQAREFSCCRDTERQSLLKFKRGITEDPAGELSSWVGKDCCSWRGVGCDDSAGHVIHLSLRSIGLEGEISPSLAALEHLTYLDLSSNGFEGPLPVFMHSFHNLRYLNLSNLYLKGPIPHQLGNLSNLRILDLSSNSLLLDDSRWLSRLTSLQQLDLSLISFERGVKWLQALNKLPSLVKLFLSQCTIPDIPLSLPHLNFTSLTTLDLSYTYFNSTLPGWFLNLTSLEFLYLEGNYFAIPFPDAIQNKAFLKEVDLSFNHAIRGDPSVRLEELCQLQVLSLSWMNITGDLNQFEGIFSGCIRKSLRILDLGGNQLNGSLPEWLGEFKNLESLFLYSNSFSGPVPTSLGRLSSLQNLMLSDNQLKGNVPESLGGLSSLVSLVLRTNSLEGVVSEKHFANMTKLRKLDLRSTSLAVKVRSDWVAPFQLETILLSSCKLGPLFPTWLKTQVNYSSLDLSYTGISDAVPHWFWNLSSNFGNLDLSHNDLRGMVPNLLQLNLTLPSSIDLSSNSFEGPVPLFPSNLEILDLSNNSFSGPIPEIIGTTMQSLSYFSLSMNNVEGPVPSSMCRMIKLRAVDLSRNHLSKELPNCWENLTELRVFDMSSNELTGVLPSTVCSIKGLLSLHLDHNNMNGNLPISMKNLTELITLDLGSNEFTGGIPSSIGHELPNLKVLSLRSNRFHGHIPPQLSNLSSLQILDLSHNSFLGTIPPTFGNFSSIRISPKRLGKIVNVGSYKETILLVTKNRESFYGELLSIMTTLDLSDNNLSGQIPEQITSLLGLWNLNLSGNHLTGEITHKFSQLIELESLDLSRNQLSGSIPPALSNLTFLSHFNVSCNNLTGRIPSGNQLNTFTDPSAFMGNPFLCGFPLNNSCDKVVTDGEAYKNKIETHNHDAIWMYISVVLGFVLGFWVVWGVLLFSEASRHSYFRAVDGFFDRVYVSVVLNFRSIKRKVLNRKQGVA